MKNYTPTHLNESSILEIIIQNTDVSRSKLADMTNLKKSSISDITKTLIEKSLIYESREGSAASTGGRKPIYLEFNRRSSLAIAIEIGKDFLKGSLAYIDGEMVKYINHQPYTVSKDTLIEGLIDLINDLTYETPDTPYGIAGIGIAIHGIIKNEEIMFTPHYNLTGFPLKFLLEEVVPYPVLLINEANAGALGEYTFSTNSENLLNISIKDGIGAGIVENGNLFTGANGTAGEIGHTTLYPDGVLCPCGNHGCLEQYSSTRILLQKLFGPTYDKKTEFSPVIRKWYQSDEHTQRILKHNAKLLSIVVNNLVIMYDPEVIIIDSEIYRAIPELIGDIKSDLTGQNTKNFLIRNSNLNGQSTLFGCVSLVTQSFLKIKSSKFLGSNLNEI